jgi:hypothetical protein
MVMMMVMMMMMMMVMMMVMMMMKRRRRRRRRTMMMMMMTTITTATIEPLALDIPGVGGGGDGGRVPGGYGPGDRVLNLCAVVHLLTHLVIQELCMRSGE